MRSTTGASGGHQARSIGRAAVLPPRCSSKLVAHAATRTDKAVGPRQGDAGSDARGSSSTRSGPGGFQRQRSSDEDWGYDGRSRPQQRGSDRDGYGSRDRDSYRDRSWDRDSNRGGGGRSSSRGEWREERGEDGGHGRRDRDDAGGRGARGWNGEADDRAGPRPAPRQRDEERQPGAAAEGRGGRRLFDGAGGDDRRGPRLASGQAEQRSALGRSGPGSGSGRTAAGGAASAATAAAAATTAAPAAAATPKPKVQIPVVRENDGDKGTFFSSRSWRQVGASDDVIVALRNLGITKPSHVQAAMMEALHGNGSGSRARHVAVADQAGSGKTLAYLLPLLQQLRSEELAAGKPCTLPGSPRAVVVAPTVELVQQVLRVVKALSLAGLPVRAAAMTGGQADELARKKSFRTQAELLKGSGVDLLVATPGRLAEHLQRGNMDLAACKGLVLDEVDVLMGDGSAFAEQVAPLKAAAPDGMRFVLVTATMPQHTYTLLEKSFPDLEQVFGPGLHRTAAGLTEELVDCSGGAEISLESGVQRKLQGLGASLATHRAQRVIVFCNKIETCRDVENFLTRKEIVAGQRLRVLAHHEAIRDEVRQDNLTAFLAPVVKDEPPTVIVCTDRTSRGMDSIFCEHVVLFDFPRDPSEYVRRVGRTARGAGGRGVVTVLVMGRQVSLARDIIDKNQKGVPVHSIPRAEARGDKRRW